jgi:hypothetical protein
MCACGGLGGSSTAAPASALPALATSGLLAAPQLEVGAPVTAPVQDPPRDWRWLLLLVAFVLLVRRGS